MQKRVGIVRGGEGQHYHHSLKRGGEILAHIAEFLGHKFKPVDILVDKAGAWHIAGRPVAPAELMHRVDIVWNTAGAQAASILETFAIPHVSPSSHFHALRNSKDLLREHLKSAGIGLPRSIVFPAYQEDLDGPIERYARTKALAVFEKFPAPWIVKSFGPDKTMGIHLAKTFPELERAIIDGAEHKDSILVEEFIAGKPIAVHSIAGFRNEDVYTLPLGPGQFSHAEKEKLYEAVKHLHRHLGAGHYLKADLLLTPRQKIYLLEFEHVPDLKEGSHFQQTCAHTNLKMHDLVEHLLERSLK